MKPFVFSAFAAILALAACARAPQADAPVTVLAAASLTEALTEVADDYMAQSGDQVRLSFASSSTLAQQIAAGAPADIFISADVQWMDYLAERGLIDEASRKEPIGNALVLIAPADSPLDTVSVDAALDLPALLGANGRIAVGDPDHVPAGIYAKEALTALGLWDEAEPRLARGEDVRAALALVARGETPLGIVYATDAGIDGGVKILGAFPADSHAPIVYPFALLAGEKPAAARSFLDYATGIEAGATFQRFGFTLR